MATTRFVFEGLDELRAALRKLPEELTGEARHVIEATANRAALAIRSAYPVRTGNLRDHVRVDVESAGRFGAAAVVKNTARHAALFEHGTQARQTAIGASRGSMPPGHVFVPAMITARRQMYRELEALLKRHGLDVRGEP